MITLMNWLQYHDPAVTLHSGGESHWLVRGDLIFADAGLRALVMTCWEEALLFRIKAELEVPPFSFYGVPRGGTAWAEAIADHMGGRWLEKFEPGCILVDDVATTGSSMDLYGEPEGTRLAVVARNSKVQVTAAWCWFYSL